jgi:hypothetical protein
MMQSAVSLANQLRSNEIETSLQSLHEEAPMHTHDDECGCIELDEEVEKLIEEDDPTRWKLNDNACGPTRDPDEVETCIQDYITKLAAAGYVEEDAERAVFDALASLVESNILPDTPDYDAPLPQKNTWIERFQKVIEIKLKAMGLDLE